MGWHWALLMGMLCCNQTNHSSQDALRPSLMTRQRTEGMLEVIVVDC
jgi:hypothetical protein